MRLEVLHVADCPNLSPMLQQLAEATDLPVTTIQVDTDADANHLGMAGSPTLLLDGVDPFTRAGECNCSVSCRLYRDETGRIVPAPSVQQLRDAITAAGAAPNACGPAGAQPVAHLRRAVWTRCRRQCTRGFCGPSPPPPTPSRRRARPGPRRQRC
jgi:hypothetical protein